MRVLLIHPIFPKTFWSFERVLKLTGLKAMVPPLSLITVAGILPQDWSFRLVDRNVRDLAEDDWEWADIVMLSAMIVQREDFLALIREANQRGKPVAVGGPYVTSVPDDAEKAGADYLVLDEGEITIPPFVAALETRRTWRRGPNEAAKRFRADGQKPDMTATPVARFDLLDLDAYDTMAIQFSRGCPFLCEFCDIINLFGRRPRTKEPEQILAELQRLYVLGWRSGVFLVDDNFIGNKKNVKRLLRELRDWQKARNYPFFFVTEASIDLAADPELVDLMVQCRFREVFIGIETPDVDSLELTLKHQNNRGSMLDAVHTVTRSGIRVMAGFIIGFDNEKPGAGERIVRFVEESNITHAFLSMLQVLPNTGLWTRLEQEGRLLEAIGNVNQTTALNFLPTRPAAEIAREYVDAYRALYDPSTYVDRVYRCVIELGEPRLERAASDERVPPPSSGKSAFAGAAHELRKALVFCRTFLILVWLQGVVRRSRVTFWRRLASLARRRPEMIKSFIVLCAHNEHFMDFGRLVGDSIRPQIAAMPNDIYVKPNEGKADRRRRKPVITSHLVSDEALIAE